jgi:hypothetical protein
MSKGLKNSVSYAALLAALAVLPPAIATSAAAPTETVIHNFQGPLHDGSFPETNLLIDKTGRLYGTTSEGGPNGCVDYSEGGSSVDLGCGTAFRLTPPANGGGSWSETVLFSNFPVLIECTPPGPWSICLRAYPQII